MSKKSTKRSEKQTPYDVFNKTFDDLMEAKGFVASILIKGVERTTDDSESSESEEEDKAKC